MLCYAMQARATRSAKMHEERYMAETQVKQMWRVMMGAAPGLKAEVAKMRATEQAKRCFELFEQDWASKHGGRASSVGPSSAHTYTPVALASDDGDSFSMPVQRSPPRTVGERLERAFASACAARPNPPRRGVRIAAS